MAVGADDLVVPFIFIPTGSPAPSTWLSSHGDVLRISARLVPKPSGEGWEIDFDPNKSPA